MSQPPPYPPPPGYFPPNYPPPPPGYPPGSYPPGGYAMPASTRTSGAAIASLILGLLFCFPIVTGLLALILGVVGISTTKNPAVRGRGMAIAGLILGILSLLAWGDIGYRGTRIWLNTTAERAFAKIYVGDLAAGNLDADASRSTGNVTSDKLAALQTQMQGWGTMQSSVTIAIPFPTVNGTKTWLVTGPCQFANGQHQFQMRLIKDSSGAYLVDSFQWTK